MYAPRAGKVKADSSNTTMSFLIAGRFGRPGNGYAFRNLKLKNAVEWRFQIARLAARFAGVPISRSLSARLMLAPWQLRRMESDVFAAHEI
uniref:Uncharacterized protein n=1 Tax=Solibacter usitatus (strain Ellin6076) TaxID=234267 RepID=Q020H7_SOLUE